MRQRTAVADRFWEKIVKGPQPNDSWIWTGAIADDGYGRFWITHEGGQLALRPQRYAYERFTGEVLPPASSCSTCVMCRCASTPT